MVTKTLMTAADFEAICETLGLCELVRGEIVNRSPGGLSHSFVSMNVGGLLWQWARKTKQGRVFTNEAGLVVETDPDSVRGADVAYYSYERMPRNISPEGFGATPPNLVVEVVGRGQGWREMVAKAGGYLRMGVDRVWIVDPCTRRVQVFRPDAEPVILAEADTLTDEDVLPGFSCAVREFFADCGEEGGWRPPYIVLTVLPPCVAIPS
jgi:Uma2 family endonuclease